MEIDTEVECVLVSTNCSGPRGWDNLETGSPSTLAPPKLLWMEASLPTRCATTPPRWAVASSQAVRALGCLVLVPLLQGPGPSHRRGS